MSTTAEAGRPKICYSYEAVDVPLELSAGGTTWAGVNDRGVAVGNARNPDDTNTIAVLYNLRTDVFESLATPAPYADSFPGGINNRGEIVGYFTGPTGIIAYFRDAKGEYQILPPPELNPGLYGASGLNERGQIVGFVVDPTMTGFFFRGLVWDSPTATPRVYDVSPTGGQTVASDISNRGTIIGRASDGEPSRGYIDRGHGPHFYDAVPGAALTEALSISNRGQIVGYYRESTDVPDNRRGYVKTRWSMREVDFPGAFETTPIGINSFGTIVGAYDGFSRGFVARPRICFD